ncbi:MAG: polysaccharide biosynthesis C-terminal domain-containing protein [Clostridia bacterium]|nr:polysaccharide biosynthesis C-terminal domain-containing protein [Clostridia bacterium]
MIRLKNKDFYKELFKLALPIALSSLVSFSVALADNMIIARLGNEAASSVYLGNQVALLLTMLLAGIEGTILVLSSISLGKNDAESAGASAVIGIALALALGAVFSAASVFFPKAVLSLFARDSSLVEGGAPFLFFLGISFVFFAPSQAIAAALRSAKRARIAFFASLSAFIVNVILNIVLVFGGIGFKSYGPMGAGIATLVSRVVEFAILFVCAFFVGRELRLSFLIKLRIKREQIKRFFGVAAPLIATQLVWAVNSFFSTALMGREGGDVIAGLSAASSLYNLAYVATNGTSGALGVIIGRAVGEGGEESGRKYREYSKSAQLIFLVLGILTAAFMQLLRAPFVSLFAIEGAARTWGFSFINLFSLLVLGTAYQSATLNGLIKSAGRVRFVLRLESFFVFCIIIPASLLASSLGASPLLIFAILKCDQLLKCPAAYLKLRGILAENKTKKQ